MGRREGGKGGWVAACARTRRGAGSCLRGEGWVGGWGRVWGFARTRDGARGKGREKMGWRMREDNGGGMGGVCTPILTFPPEGGREGRDGLADAQGHGTGRVREDTGRGSMRVRGGRDGLAGSGSGGGRLFARKTGGEGWGMGCRMRGDTGRGRVHVRGGRDGLAGSRGHGTRAHSCSRGEGWAGAGDGRREGGRDSSTSLRCARNDMWGGLGRTRDGAHSCSWGEGWIPACARTRDGGACVFAGGGMGAHACSGGARLFARTTGGEGWVSACARTRDGGGFGFAGGGMGWGVGGLARITGWGGFVFARTRDGGGFVFAGGGMGWRVRVREGRDGLAHARGHGMGAHLCSRGEGWVGGGRVWGFARTTGEGAFLFAGVAEGRGDGFLHARGQREGGAFLFAGGGIGWRVREDNGGGRGKTGWGRREGRRDSSTSLRCARNDMWGGTR